MDMNSRPGSAKIYEFPRRAATASVGARRAESVVVQLPTVHLPIQLMPETDAWYHAAAVQEAQRLPRT